MTIPLETLELTNFILSHVWQSKPINIKERVYKSIGLDLSDKFASKMNSVKRKHDLFYKKSTKVALKLHEAWALKEILISCGHLETSAQHSIQTLINQLDQKLA